MHAGPRKQRWNISSAAFCATCVVQTPCIGVHFSYGAMVPSWCGLCTASIAGVLIHTQDRISSVWQPQRFPAIVSENRWHPACFPMFELDNMNIVTSVFLVFFSRLCHWGCRGAAEDCFETSL